MTRDAPLLTVEGLTVEFGSRHGPVKAVRDVSVTLGQEKLAIVGESGSGKSMTGRSIMRLVPRPGRVNARRLDFDGIDLLTLPERRMRRLRGNRIALIMQDPKFSLNPVMTIGAQIGEALRFVQGLSRSERHDRVIAMLEAVQIRDPSRVAKAYPHELSGGMGQRAMIAMMLAAEPDLLIADEPTSALDVTVQMEVLAILDELVTQRGMGLIFISHDLRLVSRFCDRVLVMYAGRILETCRASELEQARHPYTRGLYECLPQLDRGAQELPTLSRDPAWTHG